ncbi:polysaccharide biosynthesis/export family protein [Hydrogenimonas sp.]|uniref:polysaccharide biosynthesis/export family protein n=1 Tax=Hydrogenimonas sp. TaxID=2231112 RepID=UPI00261BEA81|nr:polysaccharide biosynthesis/export family protein [Hydrogenimonas sp.]
MKRLVWALLLPLAAFYFSGCSQANKDYIYFNQGMEEEKVVTEVSDEEYQKEMSYEWKIQPGDRLEIRVFNQSASSVGGQMTSILDQSLTYMNRSGVDGLLVPPDGKLNIPLIGEIKVSGLTEKEASERLILAYKKYLRNPYVSVKILNQRLFVLGEVSAPGVIPLHSGTMTLFEALATAGDLTEDGRRTDILIIRGDLRNPQIRQVDLTNIKKLKLASLILRPNDIVYVQPRDFKAFNKGLREKAEFFNFLNTVMSPFLTFKAVNDAYDLGIVTGGDNGGGVIISPSSGQ